AFYKKLYYEFRIISGYATLEDYQKIGIKGSLFKQDATLQKQLFELYKSYTETHIDLNFYDLTKAIAAYKAQEQNKHLHIQLFGDEVQYYSRRQVLNLMCYAGPTN